MKFVCILTCLMAARAHLQSFSRACVFAVCRLCVGLPAVSYKPWQTQTTLSASGIVVYVTSYCSDRIEKQSLNTVTGIQYSTTWIYAFSLRSNLWCVLSGMKLLLLCSYTSSFVLVHYETFITAIAPEPYGTQRDEFTKQPVFYSLKGMCRTTYF